jgi:hypothetical protein
MRRRSIMLSSFGKRHACKNAASERKSQMLSTRTTALAERYGAHFAAARPFKYVVMDDFLDEGVAARLLEQFPTFESGNARTEHGTLGNKSTVERIRELAPDYAQLDDLVQSEAFVALVGRITGCARSCAGCRNR